MQTNCGLSTRRRRTSSKFQKGFSLLEALIGMAIVAVSIGAFYSGITYGLQKVTLARENLRATQIILEKMETMRLYRWDQFSPVLDPDEGDDGETFDGDDPHVDEDETELFVVPSTFSAPFDPDSSNSSDLVYTGTFTVTNAPVTEAYGSQVVQATVTVTWNSCGKTRTRQMTTYFARYGMQNSIPN